MFAIKRPIAILMFTLVLAIFGYRSMRNINNSFLPEIGYPEFVIVCEYENSSSEEIEKFITRPLEETFSSLNSLLDIVSYSRDGFAIINLQFSWDIEARYTMLRIREKINSIYDTFPTGTKKPFIMDFNPSSMPIMEFVVSGENDISGFNDFAKDVIKTKFPQVDGIAGALISGLPDEGIQIIIDNEKLANYGIQLKDVERAIKDNLPDRSFSNRVKVAYAVHSLTIKFPIHNVQDMLFIPINNSKQVPIKLKNIANVKKSALPFYSHVYNDTSSALFVSVFKESGTNSITASKNALSLIENLKKEFPKYKFNITKDQGSFVDQAISSLQQSIGIGAILAFFVILLFLKNFRYSLIIATVIPVSLLFTFNAMFFHNITFNIMTLGGLALGIGLIVDNGIVVLDSIEKKHKIEKNDASIFQGMKQVRRAIIGSTFTTIAIFFPIVYIKGYTAVLFKEQALVIIYVLLISLFASLTLVPVLFKIFSKEKNETKITENKSIIYRIIQSIFRFFSSIFIMISKAFSFFLNPVYKTFDFVYEFVYKKYHQLLEYFLNHKLRLFLFIFLFFIIVLTGYKFLLSKQYWPNVPIDMIEIRVNTSTSYPYQILKKQTKETINNLSNIQNVSFVITKNYDPYSVDYSNINSILAKPGYYTILFSVKLDKAIVKNKIDREKFKKAIILNYNDVKIDYPSPLNKEISSKKNNNFIVNFSGKNEYECLKQVKELEKYLKNNTVAEDITINDGGIKQVYTFNFNMSAINKYGLSTYNTADELQSSISGKQIGYWQENRDKIPIILFTDSVGVKSQSRILQNINDPSNIPLRNSQLFDHEISKKKLERKRVNRKSVISLSAFVNQRYLKRVSDKTNKWINERENKNVKIFISGESVRTARSFYDLFLTFLLAIIIVYLILAAQFESFLHPINIILIVPIGVAGAIFGLILFGLSLNIISIIGMVMLIGIGVNDAIIKLDYMILLSKDKKLSTREIVLIASRDKFRPIIMTTLTTIVAMLPMALGLGGNSEINQPLSISIISGLSFTTILTLFITPAIFEIMSKKNRNLATNGK